MRLPGVILILVITFQSSKSYSISPMMDEKLFWEMMEEICSMGNFIIATGKDGASANLKGKFNVGMDGREKVIENASHDHVHLYPEKITGVNFTFINVGYGDEPCIEIINDKKEAALKFFYQGSSAGEKFENFQTKFKHVNYLITGSW